MDEVIGQAEAGHIRAKQCLPNSPWGKIRSQLRNGPAQVPFYEYEWERNPIGKRFLDTVNETIKGWGIINSKDCEVKMINDEYGLPCLVFRAKRHENGSPVEVFVVKGDGTLVENKPMFLSIRSFTIVGANQEQRLRHSEIVDMALYENGFDVMKIFNIGSF